MAQSKIKNIVSKNDPLVKTRSLPFNFSVGGNATQWVNLSYPVEPGYRYLGILGIDAGTGGYRVYFPTYNVHGVRITNPTGTAQSGTGYLRIGYIREDIFVE